MESEKVMGARRNEVGYCSEYCRTCHWYTDALRKPATQLLGLVKSHFEVAGWINYKGGSSKETIKGLEILSKSACAFNCKGGGGWSGCPVRKCCIEKGFNFCFECPEFPCERNWGEKSEHANIFTADKIRQLQEMKKDRRGRMDQKAVGVKGVSRLLMPYCRFRFFRFRLSPWL